jgi:hypothetical protein
MAIIEFGTDLQDRSPEADVAAAGHQGQPDEVGDGLLARLSEPLDAGLGARLTAAWVAIYTLGLLLEPAPANPHATPPVVEAVIGWAFVLAWVVMAAGFAQRKRYGAASSLVASIFLAGLTVACPVSGHHAGISGWWLFEAAGSAALVGLSARALKRA